MYRGRYLKETPPGYSGVAFASEEKEVKTISPTPVENGAGEVRQDFRQEPFSKASDDTRNEILRLPRDFSGTAEQNARRVVKEDTSVFAKVEAREQKAPAEMKRDETPFAFLSSLFKTSFTLEDLLLMGTALLLATKEKDDESFPFFALALMLLGSG